MNIWGKPPPWLVLLGILILGLLLIVVPNYLEWKGDLGIIPAIGIAFLTSSILGFTIDRWMRAELRTDAFQAALGHVLVPNFVLRYLELSVTNYFVRNIACLSKSTSPKTIWLRSFRQPKELLETNPAIHSQSRI